MCTVDIPLLVLIVYTWQSLNFKSILHSAHLDNYCTSQCGMPRLIWWTVSGWVSLPCRASRSVEASLSSAEYEVMLAKVICQEAFLRAKGNLTGLTDSASLARDQSLKAVAQQLCSNGGTVQLHPLSYWGISSDMAQHNHHSTPKLDCSHVNLLLHIIRSSYIT